MKLKLDTNVETMRKKTIYINCNSKLLVLQQKRPTAQYVTTEQIKHDLRGN